MSRADEPVSMAEALREAMDLAMERDPSVILIGEGVADPAAIFGTTTGLPQAYGADRVIESPVSENGMTGVAIGAAIQGARPVMTHQRVDFLLLALEQLANNAAKMHFTFGGAIEVPIVVRGIIGRGWGQSAQHAQSLESVFAHFPGLTVLMPSTPYDAKGMLLAAVADPNPVIFLEHRWLHRTTGIVPEGYYESPLDSAQVARVGSDATVVATSLMVVESIRAARALDAIGVSLEVIDLRVVRPLDVDSVVTSVEKTGHLLVADTGWTQFGVGAEVIASVTERALAALRAAPSRLGLAPTPAPASRALIGDYYPDAGRVVLSIGRMLGTSGAEIEEALRALGPRNSGLPLDVPDPEFKGPF